MVTDKEFWIDGDSRERISEGKNDYGIWKVMTHNNENPDNPILICGFYGSMSATAAMIMADRLNAGKKLPSISDLTDYLYIQPEKDGD